MGHQRAEAEMRNFFVLGLLAVLLASMYVRLEQRNELELGEVITMYENETRWMGVTAYARVRIARSLLGGTVRTVSLRTIDGRHVTARDLDNDGSWDRICRQAKCSSTSPEDRAELDRASTIAQAFSMTI